MRLRQAVVWLLAASAAGCGSQPDPWAGKPAPRVVTTFAPLACFAKNVMGDHGSVYCLTTQQGPHEYQFNATDARFLRDADLFLANGLGLDDAKLADKLAAQSGNPKLRYIKLGDRLPDSLKLKDDDHDGHDHGGGDVNPHVWLGIPQAIAMVDEIRDALAAADLAHAEDYRKNAAEFTIKLERLGEEGRALLKTKSQPRIVSFHEALGYLAPSFGLTIVGVIERSPGDEPTANELAALVDRCVKEDVGVIAVEPQYPRSTSATALQAELKAKGLKTVALVAVDPLETCEVADVPADWYLKAMRENLQHLADALR